MIDRGFIDLDEPHLWVDEHGVPIGDGTPPFVIGDRVEPDPETCDEVWTGTVVMLAYADDYTFHVAHDDGRSAKHTSWELRKAI